MVRPRALADGSPPVRSRGFRFGDALGKGFSVWWNNIGRFILLSAFIYIPFVFFIVALLFVEFPDDPVQLMGYAVGLFALSVVLDAVVQAAVTYGVIEQLRGHDPSIGRCLGVGASRILPVLGVALIVGILGGLGMIFCCLPGLLVQALWWVAVPAVVVERLGVIGSLERSSDLTSGVRWPIVGIIVILLLMQFAANAFASMLEVVVGGSLEPGKFDTFWGDLIVAILLGSLKAVMAAVGYYELRTNKEGIGIDDIARIFD